MTDYEQGMKDAETIHLTDSLAAATLCLHALRRHTDYGRGWAAYIREAVK